MARRIVPPDEYPWWVQVSQYGIPKGRAWLWVFVWLSLACAVGLIVLGLVWQSPLILILSPLMATAALPYWLSIRWIDRHGSWGTSQHIPDEYGD